MLLRSLRSLAEGLRLRSHNRFTRIDSGVFRRIGFVLAGALAALWQPLAVSGAVVAGSLPGGVAVDNQGSASYGIPIEVVPGTGGLQPDLALHYNSRSANGMVGVGWSVAGLSTIARGPTTDFLETTNRATYDPENYKIHGVDFTNYDRFYLDGQKLVAVSGSYGANNAVYRTLIDSFARVTSHGNAGGGPAYFKVRTKDGLYMEYGNSSDSRIEAQNRREAMFWALNKVTDTVGNTMTFHYTEDSSEEDSSEEDSFEEDSFEEDSFEEDSFEEDSSSGEYRIDRIEYSYDGTDYDGNSVEFVYETGSRPDVIVGYLKGSKMSLSKRLHKIVVKEGEEVIREYHLAYIESPSSRRSLLYAVTLHAGSEHLPPTRFTWQHRGDHAYADTHFAAEAMEMGDWIANNEAITQAEPVDIDGDGRLEVVKLMKNTSVEPGTARVELWQYLPGAGDSEAMGSLEEKVGGGISSLPGDGNTGRLRVGDVDGDGRSDLIWHEFALKDPCVPECSYDEKLHVYRSNGEGFDASFTVSDVDAYTDDFGEPPFTKLAVLDFNGDGRADLLSLDDRAKGQASYTLYRSQKNASGGDTVVAVDEGIFKVHGKKLLSTFSYSAIDFNGDGMGDLMITFAEISKAKVKRGARVYLSNGSGFETAKNRIIALNLGEFENSAVETGDVNGDGLTDLIHYSKEADQTQAKVVVHLSTGTGLRRSGVEVFFHWIEERRLLPIDVNGDRQTDLLIVEKDPSIDPDSGSNAKGRVLLSRGLDLDGGDAAETFDLGGWSDNAYYLPFEFDIDGKTDLLKVRNSDSTALADPWVSRGKVPDLLIAVTDGLGAKTEIEYASLIRGENYTSGLDQDSAVLPAYPILQFQGSPLQVVTAVRKDDGRGEANTAYENTYEYEEGNVHLLGYGFLGFRTFTSYDPQKGVCKVDTASQSFPYTGMVETSLTYLADSCGSDQRVLVSKNQNLELATKSRHPGKIYFPYIGRSVEERHEVLEGDDEQPSTYYQRTSTTSAFDDYGNNTQIVIDYDYAGTNKGQTTDTTTNTFENHTANGKWHLGRLTKATVTAKVGDSTQTRSSSFTYDAETGLLSTETIEPDHTTLELTTVYERDDHGNVVKATVSGPDVSDRQSTSVYDATKRYVVSATNALGHTVTHQYEKPGYGVVTRTTDPNALSINWQYDGFGRPTLETRPDGTQPRTTRYRAFDLTGDEEAPAHAAYAVMTEVLGDGVSIAPLVTVYYDRQGREMRSKTLPAEGDNVYIFSDTHYDALGRTEKVSDSYFSTTTPYWTLSDYDSLGRPKYAKKQKVANADPENDSDYIITKLEYNGLESTVISDWGSTDDNLNQSTVTTRDVKGQTVSVVDADNNTITYSYDPGGNLLSTTDPEGNTVSMSYDIRGNRTAMSDPDMGDWSYTYNTFGELISQTDAKGTRTDLVYDDLGRLTSRTITPSSGDALDALSYSWTYDTAEKGIGAIASESGPNDYSRTYTYDSLGRPWETTRTINATTYTQTAGYDSYSRVVSITYPGGFFVTNTYNERGYITEVEDSTDHIWWQEPDYDYNGRPVSYQYGNAAVTQLTYERGTEFLTSILSGTAGSPPDNFQNLSYTYDHLGNLKTRVDSTGTTLTETFQYDDLNRLKWSRVSGLSEREVSYNSIGNIITKDGVDYDYTGSRPHAVSLVGGVEYTYDANGNITQRGDDSIWWTPFNKPLALFKGSNSYTFFYDNDHGRILESIAEEGTTRVKVIAGGLYETITENGITTHRHFIPTPSGTAGIYETVDSAAERLYLHGDHLGSSSVVTNTAGAIVESHSYDPWGNPRNPGTWADDLSEWPDYAGDRGFTGHEMLAALELVHMNARIYDPLLGRFLSADSIIQFEGDLQSYNRYSYVLNNPLKYTDPSGNAIHVFAPYIAAAIFGVEISSTFVVVATIVSATIHGAVTGGVKGAIQALVMSITSMALSNAIGSAFDKWNPVDTVTKRRQFNFTEVARAFTHGIAQGAIVEGMGGEFRSGFAGAFAASIFDSLQGAGFGRKVLGTPGTKEKRAVRTVAAAVVGGTVSELSGGKFANGAISAAMVHLFRQEGAKKSEANEIFERDADGNLIFEEEGEVYGGVFMKGRLLTVDGQSVIAYTNLTNDFTLNRDCHGYTLADGKYWIDNQDMQTFLDTTTLLTRSSNPTVGTLAVYRDSSGDVVHSGFVHAVDGSSIMIRQVAGRMHSGGGPIPDLVFLTRDVWLAPVSHPIWAGNDVEYWIRK